MELIAITYIRPALTLASTISGPKGTTAQTAKAGIRVRTGAMKYSTAFAFVGTMTSLNINLKVSAKHCVNPLGPTRFGPRRTCIAPIILRSQ